LRQRPPPLQLEDVAVGTPRRLSRYRHTSGFHRAMTAPARVWNLLLRSSAASRELAPRSLRCSQPSTRRDAIGDFGGWEKVRAPSSQALPFPAILHEAPTLRKPACRKH